MYKTLICMIKLSIGEIMFFLCHWFVRIWITGRWSYELGLSLIWHFIIISNTADTSNQGNCADKNKWNSFNTSVYSGPTLFTVGTLSIHNMDHKSIIAWYWTKEIFTCKRQLVTLKQILDSFSLSGTSICNRKSAMRSNLPIVWYVFHPTLLQ